MEVKNEQLAQRAREQQGSLDKDRAVAVAVAALTTVGTGIKRHVPGQQLHAPLVVNICVMSVNFIQRFVLYASQMLRDRLVQRLQLRLTHVC